MGLTSIADTHAGPEIAPRYPDATLDCQNRWPRVGSSETWNMQGTCTCFGHTWLARGIKNVFDRDPPFSNQTGFLQHGYNPQYGDPRGRVFYASVTVTLK